MSSTSLSMLLHWAYTLVRLFLAKAIGHSVKLPGASFLGKYIPSLTCRRLAPRPTPDASFSRYKCPVCCGMLYMHSS